MALLSPFDTERYWMPWRPLVVSPIGVVEFFSAWGVAELASEVRWVLLPMAACWVVWSLLERLTAARRTDSS